MKKIKICYVINSIKKCGPVNILISMLKSIDRDKFLVSIITLIDDNDDSLIFKLKKEGIDIYKLNYKKNCFTLLKASEISKKIDSYNFDLLHIHGSITSILCRKSKTKKIVTVHNRFIEDFREQYGYLGGYIFNTYYINIIRKFDKVVCCSQSSFDIVKKDLSNSTYVRNGIFFEKSKEVINKERNIIRKKLNIPLDAIVYIYVGNYNKNKNVVNMLDFYSNNLNENEYLITVGSGKLYNYCQKFSSKHIIQVGYQENVFDYLKASDIYTSFSLTEGLSVSIIEAMHYNLSLLVSAIDSHKECINLNTKYYIGEYFDCNNISDIILAKKKLLINKNKCLPNVAQNEFLSSKIMMQNYEKIYYDVLNKKNSY